jgi:4-hydroxy-tetrahydrodipicolinate reductase
MGRTVRSAVDQAPDLELSALIDPKLDELEVMHGVVLASSLDELPDGSAEVLVDFTVPSAANSQLARALERGFHVVVGTTGLSPELIDAMGAASELGANAVVAPNFALGAVLLMRFAAQAARYYEAAEIIELHHDQKVDAPSGTAMATAVKMAEARDLAGKSAAKDPTSSTALEGARGGRGVEGIPIHSVRLPGLVAHEEVIFGGPGETLTLRHDSIDRVSFMAGVLLAVRAVPHRRGVTIGLENLLED